MELQKNFTDASKVIMKDGVKDIATKVIPIVASGVATIAIGLLNKGK